MNQPMTDEDPPRERRAQPTPRPRLAEPTWTVDDARTLYGIPRWGAGFFDVGERGTMLVRPRGPDGPALDLADVAADLAAKGIGLPALVRFTDILRARTDALQGAFEQAIAEHGYPGAYRAVIPIKVNQQWHVARAVVEHGRRRGLALEVGTKPELYIALGLATAPDDLIVCNGFKDRAYVELALGAGKLGRRSILVLDRVGGVDLVVDACRRLGVRPRLGVRVKLSSKGAGCWSDSSGDHSKFGLDMAELLETVEALRRAGMLDCLELLHFHIGSQITALHAVEEAAREASRIFAELRRAGVRLRYLDCGGGLAVDYGGAVTGGRTVDYSMAQYAGAIVGAVGRICAEVGVPAPTLLTESGRALLAHHSVLLFDVLEVHRAEPVEAVPPPDPGDDPLSHAAWRLGEAPFRDAEDTLRRLIDLRAQALERFNAGRLDLRGRARFEAIAHTVERRVRLLAEGRTPADIYYCNFSLFQSLPDHWGIDQLFPVAPVQRLDEAPARRAVLADLSCDSHGMVQTFIGRGAGEHGVMLHEGDGGRYVLGAFLVGAYQKSLSSLHNLFGATNAVHLALCEGGYEVHEVAEGETMADVLEYVRFPRARVLADLAAAADAAVQRGALTRPEADALLDAHRDGMHGTTYLVDN